MSRRRLWLGFGLAALLGLAVLASFLEPTRVVRGFLAGEQFCAGRPASYWRQVLRDEGSRGTITSDTRRQFVRAGGDSVPLLIALARDPDVSVRWPAVSLLGQIDHRTEAALATLVAALHDGEPEVRLKAISALARWGKTSKPAVPDLTALLHDPEDQVAHYADLALWQVDEAAAVEACGWRPFRSATWMFTATFPADPEEKSGPNWLSKDVTQHSFAASHRQATRCIITVAEQPAGYVETRSEEERFDAAREAVLAGLSGKLLKDEPVEHQGLRGRELVIEAEDGIVFHDRLFWVGRRFYQVTVTYSPRFVNSQAAGYFLNSFRLEDGDQEKPPVPAPR